MPSNFIKYAFIAGEISPNLFGRSDLTKYDLAVAEARNCFVDYRGGIHSRPGTEFIDFVTDPDNPPRWFPFVFSPDLTNSYVLLFGPYYVRFLQEGSYVLEEAIDVIGVVGSVVEVASHNLLAGDLVKVSGIEGLEGLNGRTLQVRETTPTTFYLEDLKRATPRTSGTYTSGGIVRRVYTVDSPYGAADLAKLSTSQYRDLVRVTHESFPIMNLIRNDHTDWEFVAEVISPYTEGPEITSTSASKMGTASTVFGVTAVTDAGESVVGPLERLSAVVNYPATEGSVSINWAPVPEANYYNVYRSIVSMGETLLEGSALGYVGRSYGTKFTDPNIIPDFSRVPPLNNNPFAPGAIQRITISDGGSGFTEFGTEVVVTDPSGSGFSGQCVVSEDGKVVKVVIKSGGEGYTAPVVSFTGGTGGTATAETAALTGTYPALAEFFQQRQIYASSIEKPVTVWGSRIKKFSNFDGSELVLDDDSYEFELDTAAVARIEHTMVTRGGLLLMTQENVWLLNGGGALNEAVTPTNALAVPQTYTGVSSLKPLTVGDDILMVEGKGQSIHMLAYSELSKLYTAEDKTLLAGHLFGEGKEIVRWAYQDVPFKVVWAVRADGALLAFTTVKAEEVFAWTPNYTRGRFIDVISIREGTNDRVYVLVQRPNGRTFIERINLRRFTNAEDAFCVDAGLKLEGATPAGTVTVFHDEDGTWRAETTETVFGGAAGWFLRVADGIFRVSNVISGVEAELELYAEPDNFIPELGESVTFAAAEGSWTLDEPSTTLGGLWHLEGDSVSILGDGSVVQSAVVTHGQLTLPFPVTRAVVGLQFTSRVKTLPVISTDARIEGKRKKLIGLTALLDKSRAIQVGPDVNNLRPMRDRRSENFGHATPLFSGIKHQLLVPAYTDAGQMVFQVDDPLPMTILSVTLDTEVGDDGD